jgi:hypothetical protein
LKTFDKYADDKHPKIFAQIERSKMFATAKIIENLYKNNPALKVKKEDIDEIQRKEKIDEFKNFNNLNNADTFNKDYDIWAKTVNLKNQYTQLLNKVELNYIQKFNDLIIDLYSPLISWCYCWERDLKYFMYAMATIESKNVDDIKKMFAEGGIGKNLKENYLKFQTAIDMFFKIKDLSKVQNKVNIRNRIAHLDYFKIMDKPLISLYTQMFDLLSYNKKLQNNIFPKLIKILESHKIVWQKYENKGSRNIKDKSFAKPKDLLLDFVNKDFTDAVAWLITGQPNPNCCGKKMLEFSYDNKIRDVKLKAKLISDKCTYEKPDGLERKNNK